MNMQQNYPNNGMMPPEMAQQGFYGGSPGFNGNSMDGFMDVAIDPSMSYVPQGVDGTKRPTGGVMAYQMKQNPYLSPSGNFRKPRHDEMIKEIQIFKGLTASGRATRVSDVNNRIRHCCVTRPYFHVLSAEKYRVVLPNNEIEVIYYVHRECDTLIVVGDTLSE